MDLSDRPTALWLLLVVLGQLSVRALVGGAALVLAPDGRLVGLSTSPLAGTPFGDFLVPGLVLFVGFGVVPAAACYGLSTRRPWGPLAAGGVAVALCGWLAVEWLVGFHRPTLAVNLGTAVAILVLASRPSVRRREDGTATARRRS